MKPLEPWTTCLLNLDIINGSDPHLVATLMRLVTFNVTRIYRQLSADILLPRGADGLSYSFCLMIFILFLVENCLQYDNNFHYGPEPVLLQLILTGFEKIFPPWKINP